MLRKDAPTPNGTLSKLVRKLRREPLSALFLALSLVGLLVALWAYQPTRIIYIDPLAPDPVAVAALPPEVSLVLSSIDQGGPFLYPKDGSTFRNRERRLPSQPEGYYREYTVPTPGSRDRGAKRVVTGNGGEFYYTADHYRSFVRIRR